MNRIEFDVAGTPRARPRPRSRAMFSKKKGKHVAVPYHPKPKVPKAGEKLKGHDRAWQLANEWYEAVKAAIEPFRPAEPWTGPIRLDITVYFERPKRLCRKKDPPDPVRHTYAPDRDNLDKSVLDALKEAGLFKDDGQVCAGAVEKWYAAKGCGPGVKIVAERISDGGLL